MKSTHSPWHQLGFAVLVVGMLGVMLVPLPSTVLDLLIASNLMLGVVVLVGALYLEDGLAFTSLPSLLLLSVLFRLTLNVCSTRLILSDADAGRVIHAFGHVVAGRDHVVGAVVFAILTLVQFGVIARGAERVAEVGARFTLDALPGKQLAIDAEQRSGQLSRAAARALRKKLDRESQFYGSMDGAMKFVKGEAVISIAITVINLVVGAGWATLARGAELETAVRTYGLLTVGDGLVSQLPALLISTAAGLVVTRVASEPGQQGSLASDLMRQLSAQPRALAVAAGFAVVLGLVPGFPTWAFAVLALLLATLAYRSQHRQTQKTDISRQEALTLDSLQTRLDELAVTRPTLLAHTVPAPYPLPRLARILEALAAEGMRLELLPQVLESLARDNPALPDHKLVEHVRRDLGAQLLAPLLTGGELRVWRLSQDAEEALRDARVEDGEGCWLAVEADLAAELAEEIASNTPTSSHTSLLVGADLRRPLWQLLAPRCPQLNVLSPLELPANIPVQVLGLLGP